MNAQAPTRQREYRLCRARTGKGEKCNRVLARSDATGWFGHVDTMGARHHYPVAGPLCTADGQPLSETLPSA